jgi:hypothetical protein
MYSGKLYRYTPFKEERIARLILHSEIYFTSPSRFNDPFDCCVASLSFTDESIKKFFVPRRPPFISEEKSVKIIEGNMRGIKHKCQETLKDLEKKIFEENSLLCFSKINDDILMFSHYADKHRGLCFEFTLPDDNVFKPQEVKYQEAYPSLSFSLDKEALEQMAEIMLATKASFWRYEAEYRSIRITPEGIVKFPADYLTGIILGCLIDDEAKKTVIEMVQRRPVALKIYQAVPNKTKYALDLLPVSA